MAIQRVNISLEEGTMSASGDTVTVLYACLSMSEFTVVFSVQIRKENC